MRIKRKIISLLLTVCLIVGVLPQTVFATEGISYLEYSWDDTNKELDSEIKTISSYKELTTADNTGTWSGTYYVREDVTIVASSSDAETPVSIICQGDVTLIIAPGKTLTINGNIESKENNITVYGQTAESNEKGTFAINHHGASSTAFKADNEANSNGGNIMLHGVNLQIKNETPAGKPSVGPALDASGTTKIYGSKLDVTSDSTALNADKLFIYGSELNITAPAALSSEDRLNIYNSTLEIKGKDTGTSTSTGMLAPDILLENCEGIISSSYGAGISPTNSLTILGPNTKLEIEVTDTNSGQAITIPNNGFPFTLGDGLYITDDRGISVDPTIANQFAERNKLSINDVKPAEIIPSVIVNGVRVFSGKWLTKDATEPVDGPLDDNYAYFDGNVLTLKNFDGSSIQNNDTLQINLEGTNTLTITDLTNEVCGISIENGNLQIFGSGSLEINAKSDMNSAYAMKAKNVTLANCNLTIQSSKVGINAEGTFWILDGTLDIHAEDRALVCERFDSFSCVKITDQDEKTIKAFTEHNWLLSEWQKDEYGHWHICTGCPTQIDYGPHNSIESCSTCTPGDSNDSSDDEELPPSTDDGSDDENLPPSYDDDDDDTSTETTSTSVTIPVSGNASTIKMDAVVRGKTVTINHVNYSKLKEVTGGQMNTDGVTIDFSALDKGVDTVEIAAHVVKQIAEAVNVPNNEAKSLEIILTNGTSVKFDAKALAEKSAQAGGFAIIISIKYTTNRTLTGSQLQTIGDRPALDISVMSGGKHISDMGGTVTLSAPYELRFGEKAEGIVVYYVDDNGNRERCETSYDPVKKCVNWKTDHLSVYMIDYEEPKVTLDMNNEILSSSEIYSVRKGDTLWAISKKYGCTISGIVSENHALIKNPNLIYAGWQLKIPQK